MSHPASDATREAHLRFLESLDRVNRAIQGAHDLETLMHDVLDAVLAVFACDRAWLLHPCDPDAPTWRVPMERTRPEYPGAFALGLVFPTDEMVAAAFRAVLTARGPMTYGPGSEHPVPDAPAREFQVQSMIAMAVYPKVDRPYMFGLHQCSRPRVWTTDEVRLFEEIGRRIADGLDTLLTFRRLQLSERRLSEAQALAHIGYWDRDPTTDAVVWSPETYRIFGVDQTRGPLVGADLRAFIHPDDVHALGEASSRALTGEQCELSCRIVRQTGEIRLVRMRFASARDSSGSVHQFGTVQDVTESHRTQEALRESEASYRSLAENTPDFIVRWDRDLRRVYVNPAFARATGLRAEEAVGTTFGTLYAPSVATNALSPILAGIRKVFETGQPIAMYSDWRTLDGAAVHFVRLVPERDQEGVVRTVLGIARDVTALKESERQLRALAEHSPDAIMRFDREARYVYANAAVERLTGVPAERFIGRPYGEMTATLPDGTMQPAYAELRRRITDVATTGVPFEAEWTFPLRGVDRVFNVRLIPETDDVGNVVTVLGVARDVTERTRALEAVRTSEERFRQVTEAIDEVFWLADADTRAMIYVSPAYDRVFGRARADLCADARAWLDAVHPDDVVRVEDAAKWKALGTYDLEYRIVRADRKVRWIHERAFPIHDAAGRVYRVAGVAEDVTRRRELEEQLRQSQKMEALGQLAGGVAHDFNNMLAVIQLQSTLLQDEDATPDVLEGIQQILAATERAGNLTRQLLTFSRRQAKQAVPLDIGNTIGTLIKLLRRVLGEDVTLETHFAPSLPLVHADPGMMEQVLMNLALNARDAMPRGGRLTISLEPTTVDARLAAVHEGSAPGPHVCLTIRDTGVGIAPHDLQHIFEPFFTTKEIGKGTGLGLATVFGIVKQHHGWIEVESEVGRGTTFRVVLPALERATADASAGVAAPEIHGGDETILLVEDEWTVRSLTRAVLQRFGYHVVEADCAAAALRAWDEHGGAFDLVVTDVIMPGGMSGLDLAESLRQRAPHLKVIYTSGYTPDVVGRAARLDANLELLRKPFGALELAQRVRQVLDEGAVKAPPRLMLEQSAPSEPVE
jgi:PAS domain S-box-containing protein